MNILALDLGTKTGWASLMEHGGGLRTFTSGVHQLKVARGTNPDVRKVLFRKWLADTVLLKKPNLIIYEMPHLRGGHASSFLEHLVGLLVVFCLDHDILYMSLHSGTLKKFATGSGSASKEEMVLTAEQRYGKVQDDNQADALHLLAWAIENVNTESERNTEIPK